LKRISFAVLLMSMIVGNGIGQGVVVGQIPLGGVLNNGPQVPVAKASISGSVVKAATGDAISGVQVTLTRVGAAPNPAAAGARGGNTPPSPQAQQPQAAPQAQQQNLNIIPTVRTDDQGKFLLPDVPPGNYRIAATRNGYAQQQYGQRSFGRPGTVVNVRAGQEVKDIAFRLIPAGTIVGRVTDARGEPLAGVTVQALRSTFDSTGKRQLQPVANAKTNDLGEYRLYWINPGRYYLNANAAPQGLEALSALSSRAAAAQTPSTPEEAQAMAQAQSILGPGKNPNEETDAGFVTMFYPNTPDTSRASTVDLPAGAELRGIDFTLIRDRKVHIRGKIVDAASGKPPEMAQVVVTLRDSAGSAVDILGALGGALQGNTYNPTTGEFEVKEVSTGRYFLQVMSQTKAPPPPVPGAPVNTADALEQLSSLNNISVPVDVYDADVENMQVTITPGVTIPGRLRVEGTPPPNLNANAAANPNQNQNPNPNAAFTVSLVSTQGGGPSILALLGGGGGGKPAADGTFSLSKIAPGDYKVSISGMGPNMFVKEARLEQKDILGGLTIGDRINSTLELTISRSGAEVDATIVDAAAKPVTGIQVVLIPETQRERHELYKTGLTDQEGKAVIRGLTPGDYRLFAWEDIEPFSYFDADILKQYEQQGKLIHARESSREPVEMKIIPAPAQ